MSYRRTSDGGEISDFMYENLQPSERSGYIKVGDGNTSTSIDYGEFVGKEEPTTPFTAPSLKLLKKTKSEVIEDEDGVDETYLK